ncbi:MAG TPA: formate dehydrogenase subunit delta [Burkholderiales bacterium]|jgi:formate dehydrogenase subunit delta|nr:formate dehydrogenase subunit delta [Burkholderiales bacterium]
MENHDPAENLVRMANRIGDFFESMPDRAEAVDGIATHIKKFWEPRMRRHILAYIEAGGSGLHPMVLEAIRDHVTAPA